MTISEGILLSNILNLLGAKMFGNSSFACKAPYDFLMPRRCLNRKKRFLRQNESLACNQTSRIDSTIT
jgi:hypothetical protein